MTMITEPIKLIETRDYWINDDTLIFKPEFNKPINEYADLIQNYTRIIFSNYTDLKILFETNNEYIDEYKTTFK